MEEDTMKVLPGQPYPLGAVYDGFGTNFSLFSEVAERVELCLFDEDRAAKTRIDLPEVTAYCWHGYLPQSNPASAMAIESTGPGIRRRATLQSGQTAAGPLRQGHRRADSTGTRLSSPTGSKMGRTRKATPTAPPSCRGAWCISPISTGPVTATCRSPGTKPSSTKPTSRGSPPPTRIFHRNSAAPTPA